MPKQPTPAYLRGVASGRGSVTGALTTTASLRGVASGRGDATGTLTIAEDVVQALSDAELTAEQLGRLATGIGGAASQEEAEAVVNAEAPGLRPVFQGLPPKLRQVLMWVLLAAIQILAAQAIAEERDDSASPEQVREIVEDYSASDEDVREIVTDRSASEEQVQRIVERHSVSSEEIRRAVDQALRECERAR